MPRNERLHGPPGRSGSIAQLLLSSSLACLRLCRLACWKFRRSRARTRAWMGLDVLGQKRFAAFGAFHHGIEHLPAVAVFMQQWPATLVDHVGVAPMYKGHHNRIQVEALLGEDVFVPFGRFLVWNAAQDAQPDHLFQPLGEKMARDPKRGLESYGPGQRTWLFL